MSDIERFQGRSQRNAARRWLGIELSAFAVLGVCLMTLAWTNHYLSGFALLVAWPLAALVVILSLRDIYRK